MGVVIVASSDAAGAERIPDVFGEVPDLASRLQGAAEAGQVIVSAATASLADGFYELEPLPPLTLKGLRRPVRAYRVLAPSGARTRLQARMLVGFVACDDELAWLEGHWTAARGGPARCVVVTGEPGIGQSRLLSSLRSVPAANASRSSCWPPFAWLLVSPSGCRVTPGWRGCWLKTLCSSPTSERTCRHCPGRCCTRVSSCCSQIAPGCPPRMPSPSWIRPWQRSASHRRAVLRGRDPPGTGPRLAPCGRHSKGGQRSCSGTGNGPRTCWRAQPCADQPRHPGPSQDVHPRRDGPYGNRGSRRPTRSRGVLRHAHAGEQQRIQRLPQQRRNQGVDKGHT